jgi:diguanylate cyclase (GGDEF)-like protein
VTGGLGRWWRERGVPRDARAVAAVGLPLAAVAAAAAIYDVSHGGSPSRELPTVAWPVVAALVAIAQSCVVHVQVRRHSRTVSLSEIPFVLGLFLLSPRPFIAACVLGCFVSQAFAGRQYREPVKLLFNTLTFTAEATIGLLVFELVSGTANPADPRAWLAAIGASIASNVISSAAVGLLIGVLESALKIKTLLEGAVTATVQAIAMGCIGLVAAISLGVNGWAGLPLLVVGALVVAGYGAYGRLAERHESLERLYRFGRVVSAHSDSDEILRGILEEVSELLCADAAALTFFTDDHHADAEAWLRRGQRLERRPLAQLTAQAGWLADRIGRQSQPIHLRRETRDVAARHWLDQAGLTEAMIVPLIGDDGVLAALTVGDCLRSARGFVDDDLRLLETVSNHASIALRHGQLVDRLRHDSLHDSLTGVGNRNQLHQEMDRLFDGLEIGGAPFAVAMLDLDAFKEVNDTFGHHQGDLLLCEVARRLEERVGRRGVVTRFGGDEFAVLLPDCRDDEAALRLGRMLLAAFDVPAMIESTAIDIGASVGIACAPGHASSRDELVKRADVAMYVAKQAGREVVVFDHAHDTNSPERLAMVAALRLTINEGGINIHVQPQVSLGDHTVVAAEALARWTDPRHGVVPPDEFVPLAERTGLIRPLTDLVLDRSIAACAAWQRECPDVAVAVNLSARSLHDDGLDEQVGRLLARHNLPARLLTLEITESSVMADPAHTLGLLHRLRLRGVRLSIDDFGTGYSSLSYLRRLPVQEVKVDRSFVQRMDAESDDAAIVKAIVELGRTLDLCVVAEGVETPRGYDLLRQLRCDVAQGYFLARPMPIDTFATWCESFDPPRAVHLSAVGTAGTSG